ncbi:hypothetical protein [Microbacterium sp.]|uniref:hypothetical protein n=1 Tax=Microbacterium sp. TaxID=51671 RepID=UPI0025D96620|nr:hypothetical protein [Microbacterium sp.]
MPSPATLARARRLLESAHADAVDMRRRARALGTETDWRARAADDYRAAIGDLSGVLDRIVLLIDVAEGDVAALQRASLADASCR